MAGTVVVIVPIFLHEILAQKVPLKPPELFVDQPLLWGNPLAAEGGILK
jgi:hypothetical protein